MIKIYSFIFGIVSGVYIAQTYDIPDIKIIGTKALDYIKTLEKNDKNNNK